MSITRRGIFALGTGALLGGGIELTASAGKSAKGTRRQRFLDNGRIRLGIDLGSGGAIHYLGRSGREGNLVNHFDRGRLIQQSYYGAADGSRWNGNPWRWNPVQGGEWRGRGVSVEDDRSTEQQLATSSHPRHWASGKLLTDCLFRQTITLTGEIVHLRCRFEYSGEMAHPAAHQEVPAAFFIRDLDTLYFYNGDTPWTGAPLTKWQPGYDNRYGKAAERWWAYVQGSSLQGIGIYTPHTDHFTCYRRGGATRDPAAAACSYLAPIITRRIDPGDVITYEAYLTIGHRDEIRRRFRTLGSSLRGKEEHADRGGS